jgi:hypothetical protein
MRDMCAPVLGKTLEFFLAQQRIEVAASVDHDKEALVERIMGVIGKAKI